MDVPKSLRELKAPYWLSRISSAYGEMKNLLPESVFGILLSCLAICCSLSRVIHTADYSDHIALYTLIVGNAGTNKSTLVGVARTILSTVERRLNSLLEKDEYKFRVKLIFEGNTSYSQACKEMEKRGGRILLMNDEQGSLVKLLDLNTSGSMLFTTACFVQFV